MVIKFVCLVAVVGFVCLQYAESAPRTKSLADMSHDDLAEKFSEFLHEDKEAKAMLELYKSGGHALSKRQTKEMALDDEDVSGPAQEGFMDRAAKFVMELVQRFLKWINTD